jgi:23S rRNA (adenine2503-C2)-methyltransferase
MLLRQHGAAARPRAATAARRPPSLLLPRAPPPPSRARPAAAASSRRSLAPNAATSLSPTTLDRDGFVVDDDDKDQRQPRAAPPTTTTSQLDPTVAAFARRRPGCVDARGRLVLKNLTFAELEEWCLMVEREADQDEAEARGGKTLDEAALRERAKKRAVQVWRWLYSWDGGWEATDDLDSTVGRQGGLSASFAARIRGRATADAGLRLERAATAPDGTTKLVFAVLAPATSSSSSSLSRVAGATDDEKVQQIASGAVETVIIPVERTRRGKARATLCVSSQVGCAQNCQFCHTGRMGLLASLSAAQIVQQAIEARRWLRAQAEQGTLPAALQGATVTNAVFMGTGEPGQVWRPAVSPAIDVLTHPLGLALSHNKVTVSTVGLLSFMRDFASTHSHRAQLALSLHATTDEVRDWIVPVNKAQGGLRALREALLELYPLPAGGGADGGDGDDDGEQPPPPPPQAQALSNSSPHPRGRPPQPGSARRSRRRLLIEYVMLKRVNDTDDDARRLAALLQGVDAKINLIAFNPHEGTRFRGSTPERIAQFRQILTDAGRVCTVRDSRGGDEAAACGQLGDVSLAAAVRGSLAPVLDPPEALKGAIEGVEPFSFSNKKE